MRTAAAWIYKSHSEILGKTFKVQDTNHRLMTGIAYRGTAICAPLDYAELFYEEAKIRNKCCSQTIIPPIPPPPFPVYSILDGGNEETEGILILDGGTFDIVNDFILTGAVLTTLNDTLSGGLFNSNNLNVLNGGLSNFISYPKIVDGGHI
jgi:hypothetical protein